MRLKLRSALAALVTIAVLAGVVVLATRAEGREATRATSNDGGAWLVDRRSGGTAHVEYTTREPTVHTQIAEPGSELSARQAPGVTLIYDQTASVVSLLDSANAVEQGSTAVPTGARVHAVPGNVVVHDSAADRIWAAVPGEFGQVDSVDELSPLRLGNIEQVLVGRSGAIGIVSQENTFDWPYTPEPPIDLPANLQVGHATITGEQAVLVDGDEWVAVSSTAARKFVPAGLDTVQWLQQPSSSWPNVGLVTTDRSLSVVDVVTGIVTNLGQSLVDPTVAPILHDGCLYVLGGVVGDMQVAAFCLNGRNTIEANLNVGTNAELRLVNERVWIDGLDGSGYLITPELEVQEIADFSAVFAESDGIEDADGDQVQQELDQSAADAELVDADELDDDAINTPPVANDDIAATRLGRPAVIDVLANDTDADGDVILVSGVELLSGDGLVEIAAGGTQIQVTPRGGLGEVRFRYRITDGFPNSFDEATVSVEVLAQVQTNNRAPVTQLDRLTGAAGTVVTANLLMNDSDPDGDSIILRSVDSETEVSVLNIHPNGDVLIALPSQVNEGIVEVPYLIEDEWRTTAEGVLQITVRLDGSNTPPDARNDAGAIQVGQRLTLNLLANDVDGDNDVLLIGQAAQPVVPGDIGFVSTEEDGRFTFEPTSAGTYLFEYSVTDRNESDRAQIRVEVTDQAQNRAPIALRDDVVLALGETRLVRTFENDGDLDGDLIGVIDQTSNPNLDVLLEQGVGYFVTLKAGAGAVETFEYRVSDGQLESDLATVVVARSDVAFQNSPPVAKDDIARVRPGRTSIIPALRNDFDPEGGPLEIITADASDEIVSRPGPLGQWIEVEVPVEARLPFAIVYTVADEQGNVGAGTVQVAIVPDDEANTPPIARPDRAFTIDNVAITIPVLANDFDPQADPIALTGDVPLAPTGGSVTLSSDGTSFVYSPRPGFLGTDRFTYVVRDSEGAEAIGFVDVGVMPTPQINTPPIANPDREFVFTAGAGEAVLDVLANDVDFDGDRLQVIDVRGGGNIAPGGLAALYLLPAEATQEQVVGLSYEISDGRGGTDETEISITILPNLNPIPPIAEPDQAGPVRQGDTVEVVVLANDSDPDGEIENLVVTTADPAALVTGQLVVITAGAESAEYSYTITDPDGESDSSFITLTVEPNLPPVVQSPIDIGEFFSDDVIPQIDLTQFVTDPDGDDLVFSDIDGQIGGTTRLDANTTDARLVSFTPDTDFQGEGGFSFSVSDAVGNEVTGRVGVRLLGRSNQPPVGTDTAITIEAGVPQPFNLPSMFDDPDIDDVLVYSVGNVPELPIVSTSVDSQNIQLGADITADSAQSSVLVTAVDRQGESAEATLTITLEPSSIGPPIAAPDEVETNQEQTVSVNVTANDVDTLGEGGLRVIDSFVDATAGTTTFTDDTITFVPQPNFFGTATVQYRIVDAREREAGQADGLLTIEVIGRPDAPAGVVAEAIGPREVTLTWIPPANNGAEILGYRIRINDSELLDVPNTSPSWLFDDRVPGEGYRFEVLAYNKAGDGDYSAQTLEVIPDEVPGPPGKPSVAFANPGELVVTWSEPANEGSSILNYELEIRGCASSKRTLPAALTYTWTGLTNGQQCSFVVNAVNQAVLRGSTPLPSTPSDLECPVDVPAAPNAPSVVRGDRQAEATWSQPTNPDCQELIEYELVRFRGSTPESPSTFVPAGTVSDTSAPLENGQNYSFEVRARNRAGWGAYSARSPEVIPCGVPLAPTPPSVARGDQLVQVTTTTIAPNNGCAVSQYQVRVNGSDVRNWPSANGSTLVGDVDGLTNGTAYTLEFRGINEIGDGAWSAATSSITPAGNPQGGQVVANQAGDFYGWTISGASPNGTPITGYQLSGDVNNYVSTPSSGNGDCLNTQGNQCEAPNGTVQLTPDCQQTAQTVSVSGRAQNTVGDGPTVSVQLTLEGCPDAPTMSTSAIPGEYTVNWSRPAGTREIYVQRDSQAADGPLSGSNKTYSATPGETFQVRVWACNEFGCLLSGYESVTIPSPTVSISLGPPSTAECWNRPSIVNSGGIPEQGCYTVRITLNGFTPGNHVVRCFSTMNTGAWQLYKTYNATNGTRNECSYSQAGRHVGVVVDGTIQGQPNQSMNVTYPAVGSNVFGTWPTN